MKQFSLIFFILFSFYSPKFNFFAQNLNLSNSNSIVNKKGGICFRIDDNWKSDDFFTLASKFNTYNMNYSLALNLGASEFASESYQDSIALLQTMGTEIMDHTPNHRTNYFETFFPTDEYETGGITIAGVDHISGINKICLKFQLADTNDAIRKDLCNVNGDTLTGSFTDIDYFNDIYFYFPTLDTLVFIENLYQNKTQIIIKDIWEDSINLGTHTNIPYYNFTRSSINLTVDGIKVLANETQKLATEYEFSVPIVTWIQPGGRHPVFSMSELSEALTPLGYVAGASFGEVQSLKVFNEYDPNDVKKFGMQWQDFGEDNTTQSFDDLKTQISDGIAKHSVLIGHNHFYTLTGTNGYVTKPEYFERIDSILAWCNTNDIGVKTYSEWANVLYNEIPDPYENVFPHLNINIDNFTDINNPNGVPDGYNQKYSLVNGFYTTDIGAPSGDYCFSTAGWNSRIFKVEKLGGIENGENDFEIWVKGFHENNKIEVIFSFPNTNLSNLVYEFPAVSSTWAKFSLSQSLTANKTLVIPDSVSVITIEAKTISNFGDPTLVSGMYLAKKKPIISANLKLHLEGPYVGSDSMSTDVEFQNVLPFNQPFDTNPWNYSGEEYVLSIPENVIDWVLVELRNDINANSVETQKAGFVKNDGTIINTNGTNISFEVAEGSYYVVIHHRNHLSIMSASPVIF